MKKSTVQKNSKMFNCLNHVTDQLSEVEVIKPEIDHREPFIVGFSFPQYANQRMLELYYNFLNKFWTLTIMENLKWTETPLLASAGRKLGRRYSPWKATRMACDAFED